MGGGREASIPRTTEQVLSVPLSFLPGQGPCFPRGRGRTADPPWTECGLREGATARRALPLSQIEHFQLCPRCPFQIGIGLGSQEGASDWLSLCRWGAARVGSRGLSSRPPGAAPDGHRRLREAAGKGTYWVTPDSKVWHLQFRGGLPSPAPRPLGRPGWGPDIQQAA